MLAVMYNEKFGTHTVYLLTEPEESESGYRSPYLLLWSTGRPVHKHYHPADGSAMGSFPAEGYEFYPAREAT
jgi:hypothetical protein